MVLTNGVGDRLTGNRRNNNIKQYDNEQRVDREGIYRRTRRSVC